MHFKSRFIALGVTVACAASTTVRAADSEPVLSLSAVAVIPLDPAVPGRTTVGSVTIVIDRWSTEPDPQSLMNMPPEKLLATLRPETPRVGVIRRGSITVATVLYAHEEEDRNTKIRRVLIATDRPLVSWDLGAQTGAPSLPEANLIDIRLSKNGMGQGQLVAVSPMAGAYAPICLAAVSTDLDDPAPDYPVPVGSAPAGGVLEPIGQRTSSSKPK